MNTRVVPVLLCCVAVWATGCRAPLAPAGEWTDRGTVEFVGEGTSVVVKEDDPLALLEARAAARALALVDLLATVKGTEVSARVSVEDLMYESLDATVTVQGTLCGVVVDYEELKKEEAGPTVIKAIATLELSRRHLRRMGCCGQ